MVCRLAQNSRLEKIMKSEKYVGDEKWTKFGALGMIILAIAFIVGFIRMALIV